MLTRRGILTQRHPETENGMTAKNPQDAGGMQIEQSEAKRAAMGGGEILFHAEERKV
jgi:hypothetical protein